jgi:hypothetical protein
MPIGAQRVLWTTPQFIKDNTTINDNVEDNILRKCISVAEDKVIHPLLGSQLTLAISNHIQAYIASGTTIPADYKTLIDNYIVPTLVEYAQIEYIPFTYKFRNKGIGRQTSPESIPAELDELVYLKQNILSTAQFYGERLVTFLRTNSATYPEFYQNSAGDIQPAKGAYSSAILIPGANRGNRFGLGYDDCGGYGMGYSINVNI